MATGLLPTYQTIGLFAPLLLVICRLAQGLIAGGEVSGGLSYVIESAPEGRRGQWSAAMGGFGFIPAALGGLFILALRAGMGDGAYMEWGWRVPFMLGGILGFVGLWLRRQLDDPEEYAEARKENATLNPIKNVVIKKQGPILNVTMLVALQAVGAYMLLGYMYSYLLQVVRISSTAALITNAASLTLLAVLLPIFGTIADRIGRKPMLYIGAVWLLASAYPAFQIAASGTVSGAMAAQALLAVGIALYAGGNYPATLELFPTSTRHTGHAIGFNLGQSIFGGLTPLVAASLVAATSNSLSPAFLLMAIAVIALVTVFLTPETRDVRLRYAILPDDNRSYRASHGLSHTGDPRRSPL
jgi:MFS transporter, MHS family, proline/betaine transporter